MMAVEAPRAASQDPHFRDLGVQRCGLILGPEARIAVRRQPQAGPSAPSTLRGPGAPMTSEAVLGCTMYPLTLIEA